MSTEIPIWLNGKVLHVSGVNKKTTCEDVIRVILSGTEMANSDVKDYSIIERWKRVERPLDAEARILKVWSHWGDEREEVRFTLKRVENEADSGRGSPPGGLYASTMRRRKSRNRQSGKPPWSRTETLHPKRLAELGEYSMYEDEDYDPRAECKENKPYKLSDELYGRLKAKQAEARRCLEITNHEKTYVSKQEISQNGARKKCDHNCSSTGVLHSTLLPERSHEAVKTTGLRCCKKKRQKVRNSENIEKLMKLILAQGATIQSQLQKLKEREEQIENIEHERHRERLEKNGRNYLLETYLGSLGEAEVPAVSDDEEKGNDSGVHTEGGSDQMNPVWDKDKMDHEKMFNTKQVPGKTSETESEVRLSRNCLNHKKVKSEGLRTPRSKSEGRSNSEQEKLNDSRTLKRTKSENSISESNDACKVQACITKDETEENTELNNIKSQIELWEKVLKINKKLEKEEETLVRLHIKIRKFQTENLKLARERYNCSTNEEEKSGKDVQDGEYNEIQNGLEKLRKDLDQNSKEIYENFTKLINTDEEVTKKKMHLKQVISDLERIEEESNMLTEMVDSPKEEDDLPESQVDLEDNNIDLQAEPPDQNVRGFIKEIEEPILTEIVVIGEAPKELVLSTETELCKSPLPDVVNSEAHEEHLPSEKNNLTQSRLRSLKISFNDEIKDLERHKVPFVTQTTKKGILKNRNYVQEPISHTVNHELEKRPIDYTPNIQNDLQDNKVHKQTILPDTLPPIFETQYTYPAYGVSEVHCQRQIYTPNGGYQNPIYGTSMDHNIYEHANGGIYTTRRIYISPKTGPGNSLHQTVTTKAQVHNDTDSSASSETSGLSSMYSNSPTAGEAYTEGVYILDTLV